VPLLAHPVGRPGEQRRASVGDPLSVRRDICGEFAAFALHLQGESSSAGSTSLQPTES
jgi:hypothetical protein